MSHQMPTNMINKYTQTKLISLYTVLFKSVKLYPKNMNIFALSSDEPYKM